MLRLKYSMDIAVVELLTLLVIAARVAACCFLLPGFGEKFIPPRIKILIAGVVSVLVMVVVTPDIIWGKNPINTFPLLVLQEALVGAFLGLFVKLLFAVIDIAGSIMSQHGGFSNVLIADPSFGGQTSLYSQFMRKAAVSLLFMTNLHFFLIQAIVVSYSLFPLGKLIIFHDASQAFTLAFNEGFVRALQFAAPFVVFALLVQVGMGLINKLIPQIQVFFVALPLQIIVGLFISFGVLGLIFDSFQQYWVNAVRGLLRF